MASRSAVLMALVAWQVTLWRGWFQGGSIDAVLWHGWLAMAIYGAVGALIGQVAQWIIELGLRDQLASSNSQRS